MIDEEIDLAHRKAVARDPLAAAPRLVYADWLEEQGLAWAQFIRLQLEKKNKRYTLEEFNWECDREDELLERSALHLAKGIFPELFKKPLLTPFSGDIEGDLRQFADRWDPPECGLIVAGGFIEAVCCTNALWKDVKKRLIEIQPVSLVMFVGEQACRRVRRRKPSAKP